MQKDETLAHERIQGSFNRLSEAIKYCGGTKLELRGDALVAKIDRTTDAVAAAVGFQQENTEYIARFDDDIQPTIRIGVAMGGARPWLVIPLGDILGALT